MRRERSERLAAHVLRLISKVTGLESFRTLRPLVALCVLLTLVSDSFWSPTGRLTES